MRVDAEFLLNSLLDTTPQLYEAATGPLRKTFELAGTKVSRCTLHDLAPSLLQYIERCVERLSDLPEDWLMSLPSIMRYEVVQQTCATLWLETQTGVSSWNTILDYFLRTQRRTIENWAIAKSFIIDPSPLGTGSNPTFQKVDLFDKKSQKLLDWLATSSFTFLRVTPEMEFLSYEAIPHFPKSEYSPGYIPDFLWPMAAQISNSEDARGALLVDSNQRGDLLISDRHHILASRIRGRWTIYDLNTLEHSIHNCLKQGEAIQDSDDLKRLSHALFRILFDVSLKRHGGLIVVDSSLDRVHRYAMNGVFADQPTEFTRIIPNQSYSEAVPSFMAVRKLIELTSIDGAVILSSVGRMLAYGAMIVPHPDGGDVAGARTIAAKSAAQHGAVAFSVSADGEIVSYFKTKEFTGDQIHQIRL